MKRKKLTEEELEAAIQVETIDGNEVPLNMTDYPLSEVQELPEIELRAEPVVASPVSPVDSVIKAEIATRARKPRKPRADAGKPRGAKRQDQDRAESRDEIELEKKEIEALADTVSAMSVTVLSGLADAYAERQNDAKWKFTNDDRVNFATAIRYVAKKNAALIAENPEMYLFGVAILGYVTPRFAIPASTATIVEKPAFVYEELPNPRD